MARKFSLESLLTMTDKWTKPLADAGRKYSGFTKKLQTQFNGVNRNVEKFNSQVRGVAKKSILPLSIATGGLAFGIKSMVSEASKIEDAVAGFTPLLGSTEKATELVNRLNKEAASTPFRFEDIAGVANQLLPVMNGNIDKTAETFRMLGDTAGGNAQKLESITRGFTKAMLKGKVDLESLNMIAEAGVPIFDQLSNELGVTNSQMFKMVSAGKVTTDQLTKTFKTMTSEGGIFFNGMQIASETFSGKMSTLKDTISVTLGAIGFKLLPIFKKYIDRATEIAKKILIWVDANQDLISSKIDSFVSALSSVFLILYKIVKLVFNIFVKYHSVIVPLSVSIGVLLLLLQAYEILMKAIIVVQKLHATWTKRQIVLDKAKIALQKLSTIALKAWLLVQKSSIIISKAWLAVQKLLIASQWVWNAALSANPIGLVIVAIAALIAIGVLLYRNWDTVKRKFMEWTAVFDNPIFATIGAIMLPFITIPILIARNWDRVVASVMRFVNAAKGAYGIVKGFLGGGTEIGVTHAGQAGNGAIQSQPIRTPVANTNSTTVNRSEVGINVNAPQGTTVEQKGNPAPGTTLNLGFN